MTDKALPAFDMAMIALLPDRSDREFIAAHVLSAFEGSSAELMDPAMYHITIANLGPLTLEDVARIQKAYEYYATQRVSGVLGGVSIFTPDDEDEKVMVLHFDSPQLQTVQQDTYWRLMDLGIEPDRDHGFNPHLTIARGQDTTPITKLNFNNQTLIFNRLYLVVDNYVIPLGRDFMEGEEVAVAPTPMKSHELSPDGNELWIYLYGVPFGGPLNGKDLDEERFTEETDVGPLEKVLTYWDHNKISEDAVYRKVGEYFGGDMLGVAEKVEKDEQGWIYRIIVDRRKKYFELLKRLAEEKLLMGSSTPFQRGVEKTADGTWKKWPVVEVTLTVNPSNAFAAQLAKTVPDLLGDEMAKKPETQEAAPVEEEVVEKVTPEVDEAVEEQETLTEQIEKIFAPADEGEQGEEISLAKAVEMLLGKVDALTTAVEKMAEVTGKVDTLEKNVNEVKLAFPVLAEHIKTVVAGGVRREGQSQAERDAETVLLQKMTPKTKPQTTPATVVSYLPPNAPGLN